MSQINPGVGAGGSAGSVTNDGTFATPARQDTGNATLASIDTKIDALTTPSDTQPISAASLPLPTGAATAANQTTGNTSLSTIATNTTGIATSANQTNGTQQSKITDGTNVAGVLAGDSGLNGVVVASGTKTYTFTTSTPGAQTILPNTNVAGYSWIEVVYTSVGSGLALTGQFSTVSGGTYLGANTWAQQNGILTGGLGASSGIIYNGPVKGNFFQIAVSALTSGTFTGTVTLRAVTPAIGSISAAQSGTWTIGASTATGSAVPANAFYTGINGGGNLTGWAGASDNADTVAETSTANRGVTVSRNTIYNGTSWDRGRSIVNATNSTGIGITAVGLVAQFDDTSPTAITENQFGNIRMSANRNLYGTIRDAAGNERGANVTAANALVVDGTALTQPVSIAGNQSVNNAQIAGNTISTGVGTSGTGTQRVVQANDTGRTLVSASGSASSSGNNTLVAAGTNRLKVYAFTLSTTSTTAVTCKFQTGAGGTDLWSVVLQAPTGTSTGANLVVQPPAWLFATASATLLNLNLSSANAVQWSVSYFDEA